jgi:hypothetical protein
MASANSILLELRGPIETAAAIMCGGGVHVHGLAVVLAFIAALVTFIIVAYNRLVDLTQRGREAWSDVDVQLKRRTDLVPNLVETVKGYAAHERGTLDQVVHARAPPSPRLRSKARAGRRAS